MQALNLPFDKPHHRSQAIRRWLIFFLVWFNFVSLHKLLTDWLTLDRIVPLWSQLPLFVAVWVRAQTRHSPLSVCPCQLLLPITRGALLVYSYLSPVITRQQSKVTQLACLCGI